MPIIEKSIEAIFQEAPKNPKSIELDLDYHNIIEHFEQLISLFTDAMKIRYGIDGKVDLNTLSTDDLKVMHYYFLSFGYGITSYRFCKEQMSFMHVQMFVPDIKDINEYDKEIYPVKPKLEYFENYKNINSTKLEDYKFHLTCGQDTYVIFFNMI